MFLDEDGDYDAERHHNSHLSVGVPGTVAGLHLAWKEHGKLPWRRLVEPAIALARDGFVVTDGLARSLKDVPPRVPQVPRVARAVLEERHALRGGRRLQAARPRPHPRAHRRSRDPQGFYEGETAALIEKEMKAEGGLITAADLTAYQAKKRAPVRGTYRGLRGDRMPPPSSGGTDASCSC